MNMEYVKFYKTKDRFEIYTLLATGCIVDGFEEGFGSIYFRFEDEDKCKKILAKLFSKKLQVFAHDMVAAIRDAHSIFYKNR